MSFIFLLFGIHAPALAQDIDDPNDPEDVTSFWAYWMINPKFTGPRFYLRAERDILQSSWSDASFQRGSMSMVVADGSVSAVWNQLLINEVDTDQDGWRDVVELAAEPPTDPNDPESFPTIGEPDVYWTTLANGRQLPVDFAGSIPATQVRPFSYPFTQLIAAPGLSNLARPLTFDDYSTQFYRVNPETSVFELYGLTLYRYHKDYPTPGHVGAMERDLVPGGYQVEYPTMQNPYQRAGVWAVHRLVPNGTFAIGHYHEPTWLLRSVESLERLDEAPVPQDWVTGEDGVDRLRFDPEMATTFRWDDLVQSGLASIQLDEMTVRIEKEDENGDPGDVRWPPTGASVVLSMANPQVTLQMRGQLLPPLVTNVNQPPSSLNGFMVFQYARDLVIGSSGDRSSVTLRVPIEMRRSYASFRFVRWPGVAGLDDSISGPNADPDGDGLTNEQEFDEGSNPTVPTIGVSNPSIVHPDTSNPDPNAPDIPYDATLGVLFPYDVTLGGSVESDPSSPNNRHVIIYERGVVYAPSSTNPFPMIDWPGVIRQTDGADVALWDQSDPNEVDTDGDGWLDVTENAYQNGLGGAQTPYGLDWGVDPDANPGDTDGDGWLDVTEDVYQNDVLGGAQTPDGLEWRDDPNANPDPAIFAPDAPDPAIPPDAVWTLLPDGNRVAVKSTATSGLADGIGDFTVDEILGLTAETQYAFRPYAITNLGVVYSSQISTFTTAPLPILTVPTVASPTSIVVTGFAGIYSATLGGNVTSDGGSLITERGVVYSITSDNDNPFFNGADVTKLIAEGTTGGVFTVSATGLAFDTTYSFRAYATSAVGTSYTSTIGSFTTSGLATITAPFSTDITSSSATLGGDVTNNGGLSVLQRGVVFSLIPDPVIGGAGVIAFAAPSTGTGVFTVNATVSPGETYFFKAYAFNLAGISYTAVGTFTTPGALATITNPGITFFTTVAVLRAEVTSDGGAAITERGFVYSPTASNSNPTIGGPGGVIQISVNGTIGVLALPIFDLIPDTEYTFKAYAINSAGTAYGAPYAFFTTFPPLTVSSPTVANITATTALLGGTVESDGATIATERGVVYSSTNNDPVIDGPGVTKVTAGGTMGLFTVDVASLAADTEYHLKAYATNSAGTSYSDVSTFSTLPVQLLGLAQVQWVEESSMQPRLVPQFVYTRAASEVVDSLNYQIELSSDVTNWLPIDENDWAVEESAEALTATWISNNSPPAHLFFRVEATAGN